MNERAKTMLSVTIATPSSSTYTKIFLGSTSIFT